MYGSVLSSFTVFDNFMGYRGGVYASSAETPMVTNCTATTLLRKCHQASISRTIDRNENC